MLKYIFSLLTSLLLFSCNQEQPNQVKEETPKALQDNKMDIKSYGRSGDLAEELYATLIDKSPDLKKLEEDIQAMGPKSSELSQNYYTYDEKSNRYYSSADSKATAIKDSILRKKILALITKSKSQYASNISEHVSLLKTISEKNLDIQDHYLALKIVLTLPMIEKYQTDYLPNKKEFKELIQEQQKLIERTDKLTPNY